ncbi:MAG TPA: hypothetical protein VEP69_06410 [Thermodesulfovibrionales bacterium]|nr:hypothetical protein [Thermodesulfovibrionales bacterium]
MKRVILTAVLCLAMVSLAFAGSLKTYQVTGPVLEVKDDMIVVQKGKEKWEIARDKSTKVTGDLKVGAKVTIQYQMKATEIEAKADKKK